MKVLAKCWRVVSGVCGYVFGSWKDYKFNFSHSRDRLRELRARHWHQAVKWAVISTVLWIVDVNIDYSILVDTIAGYALAVMFYHLVKTIGFGIWGFFKAVIENLPVEEPKEESTTKPEPAPESKPEAKPEPAPKKEPEKTLLEDMIEKKVVTVVTPEPEPVAEPVLAEEPEAPEPVPTPAPEPVAPITVEDNTPKEEEKPKAIKPKARPNTWRKPRAATNKELEGLAEAFNHKPTK